MPSVSIKVTWRSIMSNDDNVVPIRKDAITEIVKEIETAYNAGNIQQLVVIGMGAKVTEEGVEVKTLLPLVSPGVGVEELCFVTQIVQSFTDASIRALLTHADRVKNGA